MNHFKESTDLHFIAYSMLSNDSNEPNKVLAQAPDHEYPQESPTESFYLFMTAEKICQPSGQGRTDQVAPTSGRTS